MRFQPLPLQGAYLVELEPRSDDRGFFARAFSIDEFAEHGLRTDVVQCNLSYNRQSGTIRGLHYQIQPAAESKLLRCVQGAIHAVIVDLREDSVTHLQHVAIELSAANRRALYVPEHFAAGMQTLVDDTELYYQVSQYYTPDAERGLRYDDPVLAISWPQVPSVISDKDRAWPLLEQPGAR
jgi:dTDP-4-dehydrorhamnose 3,5-epimerase